MPGECLRDVALGQRCWLRDGFDLGKLRRRSSTPAVVPGAALPWPRPGSADIYQHLAHLPHKSPSDVNHSWSIWVAAPPVQIKGQAKGRSGL